MLIKQLSIFIENRLGRLAEVTDVIAKNDVNLHALVIADTEKYGVLRIIVDDPDGVERRLKDAGLTVAVTSVISVKIDDVPGGLSGALKILAENRISIEYMYSVNDNVGGSAYVVMRVDNDFAAQEVLKAAGYVGFESIGK